ncbi:MAG: restriction endonuclease [Flavobacteriaceae bacterium]|nr:restriction endonuclease [Flavobacteriaceae bacterium]|tara:strand:- start:152 stop:1342 length:1191 start_codon:yes stop_codon:yes gene_type:complete
MKSFVEIDQENNGDYIKLLSAISKLSGLFSESSIPLINYRVAENIFCRSFSANNLSRSDVAFDADYNSIGIGLKTFTCPSNASMEKVAEFNKYSRKLKKLQGKDLALKLSEHRNERIDFANRIYDIDSSLYHIVARRERELILFETDYQKIDITNINSIKENKASLQFEDGNNLYSFNYSKSTLFRRFVIPNDAFHMPVDIIDDPYSLLLDIFNNNKLKPSENQLIPGKNFVILPLYGIKNGQKFVFEKSGLNQWNAGGRKRNENEIYIPVPAVIHHKFPDFFPPIESDKNHFNLHLPNRKVFKASMCQTAHITIDDLKINKGKGLMTKSNKGLGEWLLRNALQLKKGEPATIEMLDKIGYDSVILIKKDDDNYKIDIAKSNSFNNFIKKISVLKN